MLVVSIVSAGEMGSNEPIRVGLGTPPGCVETWRLRVQGRYHARMSGLFAGTPLERPVTCEVCERPLEACECPRDAEGNVCLPRDQIVIIQREKRSKGKIVTAIAGLDPVASNLPALLRELQRACGTGGSVQDETLLLQGDHCDRAAELLREKGYRVKQS